MITAPAMTPAQAEAWHALFEVYKANPEGWALVGGQMVHSLCWEREANPPRPTQDADAVLDIRAHPTMLFDFTKTLTDLGFKSPRRVAVDPRRCQGCAASLGEG